MLISISAYLSSSEAALFSLSRFQLRALKERFKPSYKKIKTLLTDSGGLLITILVTNEVVNVSLASLITSSISTPTLGGIFPAWAVQTIIGVCITAPIVLIFCEGTPKVIGARANQIVAPLTATPLTWIYNGFNPIRFLIKKMTVLTSQALGKTPTSPQKSKKEPILKEEEFLSMLEEGHKEGSIHQSELELIKNIFELDDRTVIDVYTPLSEVFSLPAGTSIQSAISSLSVTRGSKYSRIPVTDAAKKNVLGILYAKDLLFSKLNPQTENPTLESLMRKALKVSPAMRLNTLFRKFKQHHTHLGVVTIGGSSGDTMGIVTMADILDAIFETLQQEKERGHTK